MPNPYRVTWDRWDEVDALFDRAMDVPSADRERFLADTCGDDRALLMAVLALLRAQATRGPEVLDGPSRELVRAALGEAEGSQKPALSPGESVGSYRVVGELGRGGMATVYEAVRADGAFERRVALKVLRHGLDTENLVRRFLVERQILSGLAHPNIATLLDGGATDDGRPFLVMELVEGETITAWAERNQLSVRERVRLFLQVIDAVGFAHGQLVVHRDLKPSNVLVTESGLVKLLDFGVAKLLAVGDDTDEALTRVAPAPLTPEYASPEQVLGQRVTAASDVFQLGALLYRLVTGAPPFDNPNARLRGVGLDATIRRPGAVAATSDRERALRGDLDTIILKTLRPEPELRYGSAEALGADLRRHLEGRPIAARRASTTYRIAKFSRRNPWFWPAAAALAVGLTGYLTTVVRYSNQLETERNEAVAQAQRAEAIRTFMVNQFGAADPYSEASGRPDVTVAEAMAAGAEAARRDLAEQPLLQAEMLSAIAWVQSNLTRIEPALDLFGEAMAIRTQAGADGSPEQSRDMAKLGSLLPQRDSGRMLMLTALERERDMFGPGHSRTADALDLLGYHAYDDAEYELALGWYEASARIRRGGEGSDVTTLSGTLTGLADSYRANDRWDDALAVATEAYELARDEFGEQHLTTANNKHHLAQVVAGRGDRQTALALYRELLPVLESTLGPAHGRTMVAWNNMGLVLVQEGDLRGAEDVQRRLLAFDLDRSGPELDQNVAARYQNLAANLLRQGRPDEADSLAGVAERIYRRRLGDEHYAVAYTLLTRGEALLLLGRAVDAEAMSREAMSILSPNGESSFPSEAARCRLGRALALQGRQAEAEPVLREAVDRLDAMAGVPAREMQACEEALATFR